MSDKRRIELLSQIYVLIAELLSGENTVSQVAESVSNKPDMLTIKECAKLTGISEHSIRKFAAQDKIKSVRAGEGEHGKILVNKDSLIDYLT
ncbi:MAG: helix-turn-helix domain-containing protein [Muribaculaceae bacterium]|nr:helix-turn-helix domain-containing protein [Muribaculaceae bacterium]